MPDIVIQNLALLEQLSYLGVFIFIVLSGHIIPIPQDLSLISAGYITALGYTSLWPVLIIGMIAPVFSDLFLFYLSTVGSRFAPKPERYEHMRLFKFATHHMHNNTILLVMFMRFVTGFRFMSPVVGAYMKVPIKKYFIANSISAAVFGPVFIMLGYTFHTQITSIINTLKSIEHFGLIFFGLFVLGVIGYFLKNMYNSSHAEE
ncbi:MAG: hypothetical protein ABIF06_01340 [bacterium]